MLVFSRNVSKRYEVAEVKQRINFKRPNNDNIMIRKLTLHGPVGCLKADIGSTMCGARCKLEEDKSAGSSDDGTGPRTPNISRLFWERRRRLIRPIVNLKRH